MKLIMAVLAGCLGTAALAQTTSFNYQGRLLDNGIPSNGNYELRLSVYDAETGGSIVGSVLTNSNVAVTAGLFDTTANFGANVFDGSARWLQIAIRTNGSTGTFTVLAPRQNVLPTPYAIQAFSAAVVSNGVYTAANQTFTGVNTFSNSANIFIGNGTGLTNVNAATLNGLSATKFWQTGGNSGTTAGTQFIGTADNQALEFKVNGTRALRIEPTAAGIPNLIGGSLANSIATNAAASAIAGGENNSIQSNSDHSSIGGGLGNYIQTNAYYSTIAGGNGNIIQNGGFSAVVAGGFGNTIRASAATITGGSSNTIETNAGSSTVGGGALNTVGTNATYATLSGGFNNTISGSSYAVISGGHANSIQTNSPNACIAGGENNTIGANAGYSLAAGRRAKANHQGSFVWADSSNFDFASAATNSFSVRAIGGVRFVTAIDGTGTVTNGVSIAAGSGSWSSLSDRNAKENFTPVNSRQILDRVAALPLSTWNYKTQDKSIRHIGPMAQDFAAAFHIGEEDTRIATIDEEGVALAAIQGLNEVVSEKDARISALEKTNKNLEKRLSDLENLIKSAAFNK